MFAGEYGGGFIAEVCGGRGFAARGVGGAGGRGCALSFSVDVGLPERDAGVA